MDTERPLDVQLTVLLESLVLGLATLAALILVGTLAVRRKSRA